MCQLTGLFLYVLLNVTMSDGGNVSATNTWSLRLYYLIFINDYTHELNTHPPLSLSHTCNITLTIRNELYSV